MASKVEVTSLSPVFKKYESRVLLVADGTLKYLRKDNLTVGVFLVGPEKMRYINKRFRGKDEETNVLSFEGTRRDSKYGEEGVDDLGEVYLCPDYIKKHKEDFDKILVHGLLHLFGYNHSGRSDTIEMEKLEKVICEKISLSV